MLEAVLVLVLGLGEKIFAGSLDLDTDGLNFYSSYSFSFIHYLFRTFKRELSVSHNQPLTHYKTPTPDLLLYL